MNQIIIFCLGMVLLAFLIPSQVNSQSNATTTTLTGQNVSSTSNSNGTSPVTTSSNTTTTHAHAVSLYSTPALFFSVAFILVLNVCC
ncbi:hypothetical protein GDO78_001294 [Eleutherodactylus coqui]|uniref:Uncharacterized protein n=1 Tax=Eleutherodactylus coqui TaxID=57060 RepID=A0A8J6FUN2_ELECQ|nr:hypothetical protein GDO78_001294 [Eleutherodactylus coqui]